MPKYELIGNKPFEHHTHCEFPTTVADKLLFQAENCEKLAEFMKKVPAERHDQGTWVRQDQYNDCGTACCAMGWAAASGIFPGLQYAIEDTSKGDLTYVSAWPRYGGMARPVVNGKASEWGSAANKFFGTDAFTNGGFSRSDVIGSLSRQADRLRERAKKI